MIIFYGLLLLIHCVASEKHWWAVQIDNGDDTADEVARSLGHINHGKIRHLNNKYIFEWNDEQPRIGNQRRKRSFSRRVQRIHERLASHPNVKWLSYASQLKRDKRYSVNLQRTDSLGRSRAVSDFSPDFIEQNASSIFKDPFWSKQWYLHDTRSRLDLPKLDLHVLPVWRRNITGRGVVVTVVDDGMEWKHPDLFANYDPHASFDYNHNTPDPTPAYGMSLNNRHGTRCAGEIAMSANNSICGVGIAFNAKIGGIKVLDGIVNDIIEARGLTHNLTHIDIYSASWGPSDDGKTFEGPGPLAAEALKAGITKGRDGRGVIYVWASGNGGVFGDNCNCDGYANSIYTISVSSATQSLTYPWYSESCSSALVTTFSSGSYTDQKMVSTDINGRCTDTFTGTSASAPVAAGIIALMLEVNPQLTWRDVQHAIVWTSEYSPLSHNPGWKRNAAGLYYHNHFGFGIFNADALTKAVSREDWKTTPKKLHESFGQLICDQKKLSIVNNHNLTCKLQVESSVQFVEHVQLRVTLPYTSRGALGISISSPRGTLSKVLTSRSYDKSKSGIQNWTFMTVHFWGEDPTGDWTITFADQTGSLSNTGHLESAELIIHGTSDIPYIMRLNDGRRTYNGNYNYVKNMNKRRQRFNSKRGEH